MFSGITPGILHHRHQYGRGWWSHRKPVMPMLKAWIKAARLRTLPLAASVIIMAGALSYLHLHFYPGTWLLALSTALLLQILSNFANDYGDFVKGTDQAAGRTDRALSSGAISPSAMRTGIYITVIACLLSGISLLYLSGQWSGSSWLLLLLGLAAIAAAIAYTVGRKAYAYLGLGDVFVFLFFGPVAICGTVFLLGNALTTPVWMASVGMGMLCTAVLNVNNMRDRDSDSASGKITLAIRMGKAGSYVYHKFLLSVGSLLVTGCFLYHIFNTNGLHPLEFAMVLIVFSPVYLLFAAHTSKIPMLETREDWNKELKRLSLSILILAVVFFIIVWFFV
ncbi:MAG: 1,4-dihydroxy-2-naphthoate octaprenyltransferase [Bacteroidetes bacterium]|nr:1,4-dihydroxy-2-naphthoate octaprenyltransferase [Bacteroidota bacterium]